LQHISLHTPCCVYTCVDRGLIALIGRHRVGGSGACTEILSAICSSL
jgi:hypothetical protein